MIWNAKADRTQGMVRIEYGMLHQLMTLKEAQAFQSSLGDACEAIRGNAAARPKALKSAGKVAGAKR